MNLSVTHLVRLSSLSLFWITHVNAQIDERPLPFQTAPVFGETRFPRPINLTHLGDGSQRLVIGTQYGKLLLVPDEPELATPPTTEFLDISKQVVYKDSENEEGLLGVAFHPRYAENGQLFLYYTSTAEPHLSVVSRFTRDKDHPDRALAESEEELLRIPQPYWNHNGGTLAFGPDGYLYIGLGDGGAFNDPHMNGQNVQTLLGSILRIDIDHRTAELPYAIPTDNPFANAGKLARPEIWAYGLRNVWRLAFDRQTGDCWAADVGQDLYEEINLIRGGGNYGWNLREGKHKFGPAGSEARADLIDPIWEYHHDVGKSITGGVVYRGNKHPELFGAYLYADYVSGKMWGLWYDHQKQQVIANRPIQNFDRPIVTFGESEQGEVYCSDAFGIMYQLQKTTGDVKLGE